MSSPRNVTTDGTSRHGYPRAVVRHRTFRDDCAYFAQVTSSRDEKSIKNLAKASIIKSVSDVQLKDDP